MPPPAPSTAAIKAAIPALRDVPAAQAGLIYRQLLDRLDPAQRIALRDRVEMAEDAIDGAARTRRAALGLSPDPPAPMSGVFFERTRPRRAEEGGI